MAAQRRVAAVARHLATAVDGGEEPKGTGAGVWERRDPSEEAMERIDINRQGPLHVKIRASEHAHTAPLHGRTLSRQMLSSGCPLRPAPYLLRSLPQYYWCGPTQRVRAVRASLRLVLTSVGAVSKLERTVRVLQLAASTSTVH